jgi:hypothetical protein
VPREQTSATAISTRAGYFDSATRLPMDGRADEHAMTSARRMQWHLTWLRFRYWLADRAEGRPSPARNSLHQTAFDA